MQYSCNSNINAVFGCCEEKVRREKYNRFAVLSSIRNVRKRGERKVKSEKKEKCFSLDNITYINCQLNILLVKKYGERSLDKMLENFKS